MKTDSSAYRAVVASMKLVFPELTSEEMVRAKAGDGHWNSLTHLRLVMELESALGVKVPSSSFAQLTDLNAIVEFFEKRAA